jgi:hypothetical protein
VDIGRLTLSLVYPPSRAPLFDKQSARNLQQEITDEENAGAETKYTGAEPEVMRHLERRVRHVDAVEKGNDVKGEYEWKEAARDFPASALG